MSSTQDSPDHRHDPTTRPPAPLSPPHDCGQRNTMLGAAAICVQARDIAGPITVLAPPEFTPPVPRQLPPRLARFVDRARERDRLHQWITVPAKDPTVIVVTGPSGIGKTALAVHTLNDTTQQDRAYRFPDGQLYGHLAGPRHTAAEVADEILGQFLRALGVPGDRVPRTHHERVGLYRSMTAGLTVSVLLDDAVTAEQTKALVPAGPGSVVLITSRVPLPELIVHGARQLRPPALGQRPSVDLLRRMIGDTRVRAESAAAVKVARLCRGNPLALGMVGALIAVNPHRLLCEVATTLTQGPSLPLESAPDDHYLRKVVDMSLDALQSGHRRAALIMSMHPGPFFDAEVTAAALNVTVPTARDALEILREAQVLTTNATDDYTFPTFTRHRARSAAVTEIGDQELASAVRAMIRHYLIKTAAADLLLGGTHRPRLGPEYGHAGAPGFTDEPAAVAWFEHLRPVLLATQQEAVERGWHDLVWQLAETLWAALRRGGYLQDMLTVQQRGSRAAHTVGHPMETFCLAWTAWAWFIDGQPEHAVPVCTEAIAVASGHTDLFGVSVAKETRARAYLALGEYTSALEDIDDALSLDEQSGSQPHTRALRLRVRAQVYSAMGRLEDAVDDAGEATRLAREHNSGDTFLARHLTVLAQIHLAAGHVDSAARSAKEALPLAVSSGTPAFAGDVYLLLADIAHRVEDAASEAAHLRQSRPYFLQARNTTMIDAIDNRIAGLADGTTAP